MSGHQYYYLHLELPADEELSKEETRTSYEKRIREAVCRQFVDVNAETLCFDWPEEFTDNDFNGAGFFTLESQGQRYDLTPSLSVNIFTSEAARERFMHFDKLNGPTMTVQDEENPFKQRRMVLRDIETLLGEEIPPEFREGLPLWQPTDEVTMNLQFTMQGYMVHLLRHSDKQIFTKTVLRPFEVFTAR